MRNLVAHSRQYLIEARVDQRRLTYSQGRNDFIAVGDRAHKRCMIGVFPDVELRKGHRCRGQRALQPGAESAPGTPEKFDVVSGCIVGLRDH